MSSFLNVAFAFASAAFSRRLSLFDVLNESTKSTNTKTVEKPSFRQNSHSLVRSALAFSKALRISELSMDAYDTKTRLISATLPSMYNHRYFALIFETVHALRDTASDADAQKLTRTAMRQSLPSKSESKCRFSLFMLSSQFEPVADACAAAQATMPAVQSTKTMVITVDLTPTLTDLPPVSPLRCCIVRSAKMNTIKK